VGLAAAHHQQAPILGRQRLQPGLLNSPAKNAVIEVVATERRIAAGRHHLENAGSQFQDRDIEGATTKVIDRVDAFRRVVQPVGNGRRGRLVEQAQDIKSGQARRILGRLALCVVEIGRHRDHRADQIAAERHLSARLEAAQNDG